MGSTTMERDDVSDEALLANVGDRDTFGVFYDRHARWLLTYFYSRTACPHTAADLTAETFAEAWRSSGTYQAELGEPRAWLGGIARHQLSRFIRRQRVETRARKRLGVERVELDDVSIERIEALIDLRPIAVTLREAMSRMSPKVAAALELRVARQLPYDDVATQLGCSVNAARVRVARGLAELARQLEAHDERS